MKPTILIVDDDELICELYSDFFKQNGYLPQTALTVDRALALIRKEPPGIVLSDVVMPVKNGIDLYRELQSSKPDIPFVFMTGYQHDPKIISQLEKLETKWISKPTELDVLFHTVDDVYKAKVAKAQSA